MKKLLTFLVMVIGMMSITATAVQAQESVVIIPFVDEQGYTVDYDLAALTAIIATSDTLVYDDGWLMEEYESVFPTKGSHEPAVLVLLPDDSYVIAIFVQANRRDKLLSFRMLTNDGWLEAEKHSLRMIEIN